MIMSDTDIVIKYIDSDGLPRAWAAGPSDFADDIAVLAARNFAAYILAPGHTTRDKNKANYHMIMTVEGHDITGKNEELRNVSLSHGTMRNEDLIPCFAAALREYGSRAGMLDDIEYTLEYKNMARYYACECAGYDLEWLFDALQDYAPDGYYFGAHPGDGSDYGFWEYEEF